MRALIFENSVVDVVATEFEVHESMTWMDCTNDCTSNWTLESGVLTAPAPYVDTRTYVELRQEAYPSIGDQLDMMFHAGLGGDTFQEAIQAVKDANSKPK